MSPNWTRCIAAVLTTFAVAVTAGPATAKPVRTSTKIALATPHKVTGKVARAKRGRTKVVITRRTERGSTIVKQSVAKVRGGRFKLPVRGLDEGEYEARARYLGSRGKKPSLSAPRDFTVEDSGSGGSSSEPADSAGSCELDTLAGLSTLDDFTLAGCAPAREDNGTSSDADGLWGNIECQSDSRHQRLGSGGDDHLTASGAGPGESSYRRLTVMDGDDFYGERCELGRNEHRYGSIGGDGTFQVYRESERWISMLSLRLPSNFPLSTSNWQTVIQMKQAQPSANGGGGPILEVQAYQGRWWLINDWNEVWSTPAQKGVWTRFAFDVDYSRGAGQIRMYVDSNGDGDASDPGEQSPALSMHTLKTEIAGGWAGDGIAPGESIPSHLRTGLYHDPAISCPPPGGCSIDVDNVQTVRAA